MELRKYQEDIIGEVRELIFQGKRRVSIVMPVGSGATTVACVIANEVMQNTIVVVHTLELCDMYRNKQSELYSQSSVLVVPINRFRVKKENAFEKPTELSGKSYILLNTTAHERQLLKEVIPNDSIVVSIGREPIFGSVCTESMDMDSIMGCVFFANELFDVRDVISADIVDSQILRDQITEKKSKTEKLIRIERMVPYGASPNATEKELESLRKTIEERDRKIAAQEEIIKIYESMLCSIGIPLNVLNENVNLIADKKATLSKRIVDGDELAIEEISNYIVQTSLTLFSTYVVGFSKEHFVSLAKACLTEAIWNKMTEESRTCIITSKVAYDSIQKIDENDNMDYSGVCILASKALDIEISKRFFEEYIVYLRATTDISKWPDALFDKNNCLLTEENLTLGTAQYVLGIDKRGNIRNQDDYNLFSNYAKNKLYSVQLGAAELKTHLSKCIQCIEKVRTNFRNPAAHRTTMDRVTAKECIDYLVDTYKKLKEILIYMN